MTTEPPVLLVVAGPAGSGKSTLCDRLVKEVPGFARVVTTTTREPRPGEKHGVHYYFMTPAEFDAKLEEKAFLEWAWVHGKRRYGTLAQSVLEPLSHGQSLVISVDVQGVESFRRAVAHHPLIGKHMTTVFILVDRERLIARMRERAKSLPSRQSVVDAINRGEIHVNEVDLSRPDIVGIQDTVTMETQRPISEREPDRLGRSDAAVIVLRFTVFGRYCYAMGSNEATARLCGVGVERNRVVIYTLAGMLTGWAGILAFAQASGSGDPTVQVGLELEVIAAAVIGGASLLGGQGSVVGVLLGVLILGVLENGVNSCGVPLEVKYILIGVIVVANTALSEWQRRRAA